MIDIDRIRGDFPILGAQVYGKPLVYLDNAATSQKPMAVLERVHSFYAQSNGNIHRGIHYLSEQASAAYEAAREKVREFINAAHGREIIFTRGTTEAINMVAACFGERIVGEGDELLVTEMEHHSNIVPWQVLCQRVGARLRVVPFDDAGALRMERLESLVSERTRLIAVCAVSNVLGAVNPLRQIIAFAHQRGIQVLVDAAQAVQHSRVDVRDLDCDFLAFSGHKIYAEMGIGVLYGKEKWLEQMRPCHYGGGMIAAVDFDRTTFAELPFKFEPGTPNVAGALGLATAIDYVGEIGVEGIEAHERDLLKRAAEGLAACGGVTLYGDARRVGVLSFNVQGASPFDVSAILDKMGIAVRSGSHCAEPTIRHFGATGMVRASVALYNTVEEIDALVLGVRRTRELLC
jgi:cysteine desulfurase / selenocysteine lyase